MDTAVSIKDFNFRFRDQDQRELFKNFSINIARGKLTAIVGPSGCGKSTLLRSISRLMTNGITSWEEFKIFGTESLTIKKYQQIGFAFQSPALLPWLNVDENVRLPLKIVGQPSNYGDFVSELYLATQLENYKKYLPNQLSGGLAQRANLVRALVLKPKLLLLDEPVSNLDTITAENVLALIRKLHLKYGITTLLVSHDLRSASRVADTICILGNLPQTNAYQIDIRSEAGSLREMLLPVLEATEIETSISKIWRNIL